MAADDYTLATELIHEIKQTSRRWFIAFCVMVVLEILTIGGFLWYISLPVEVVQEVDMDADEGNANYIGGDNIQGEINNGEN